MVAPMCCDTWAIVIGLIFIELLDSGTITPTEVGYKMCLVV